jgi:electron transfer flavoprotein alpha subunit
MENVLVLLHTEADGALPKAAFEAIGAAGRLAASLGAGGFAIGIVGGSVAPAAAAVAGAGAVRVLAAEHPAFAQSRYATDAAAAASVCRASGATVILAPMTARWARAIPGVAHRLGGRVDTHITGLSVTEGAVHATRWFYRQRMEGTITRSPRPWVLLLDPGAHQPWSGTPGAAAPEMVPVEMAGSPSRTTVVGVEAPAAEQQTIKPDAELLFVAGAGWTKKQADGQTHTPDAEALILGFLRASRASLGSSKSLVDLSGEGHAVLPFMSHMNQVGQTGSTPRHPKGLATCCHGEEPHVVGWRFITERRAVNLDPNCGWARGKADVLYVADAFAVMKAVNALLDSGRAES